MKKLLYLFFGIFSFVWGNDENFFVKKIDASFLLHEPGMALDFAKEGIQKYPHSKNLYKKYVQALSLVRGEKEAIQKLQPFMHQYPDEDISDLSEEIAWNVIEEGSRSTQYNIRLTSLVSAYLTQDMKAIEIIRTMMRDSNAILRAIAVQLSSHYRDQILQDEIIRLFSQEKVYLVRLEILKAIGQMKIQSMMPSLESLIGNNSTFFEEKALAIQAAVKISSEFTLERQEMLLTSSNAGLRHLFCELALHHHVEEAGRKVLSLVNDPIAHVRIAALNSLGLFFVSYLPITDVQQTMQEALEDFNPVVSITAAWVSCLMGLPQGESYLEKWVFDENPDTRRFAAGVIAALGDKGIQIAQQVILKSSDPYVRANIALGLLGQRKAVKSSLDELYNFFVHHKEKWMWDTSLNSLFAFLAPSQIRHVDQIPSYPEAVDNMAKLRLLSILAVLEDSRAEEAICDFLRNRIWGITSLAAATLIGESDEEMLSIVKKLCKHEDLNISLQAALVLAMYGKDIAAIDVLKTIYPQIDKNRKLYILEAMGYITGAQNAPFYLKVLQEPSLSLRVAGASSFIRSLKR
ncbi:MAG: hypothetical protein JW769_03825 [Parachlamydiales bacterium]|nr:hypothetical protein [Parachlamydiales bacterium]